MKYSKRKFQKRSYKRKTPYKKKSVSFAVKKYVKTSIHRQIENKMIISYATNQSMIGPQYILALAPLISQGTGESGRIGNKVNLLSASINFVINLVPYNVTTNPAPSPVMFRWMFLTQLSNNSGTLSLTNFFQINNSSIGIQGNHLDLLLTVNKELYKVHKQGTLRLGASSNSTATPVGNSIFEAGKASLQKRLYFNKYLHKKMNYDDTVVTPSNTNCWFIIFPVNANGSTNVGYANSQISYTLNHTYEDA